MKKEDQLMLLTLLARQQLFIDRIVEVLKNRLLSNPEKDAWDALLDSDIPEDSAFQARITKQYHRLAEQLGIDVDADA